MNTKKYLIIGGAGFIGSHFSEALLKSGNKVVIIDDFSTGKKENTLPDAKTYHADIDNAGQVDSIFKKEMPDFVYHFAGVINLRRPVTDPLFLKSLDVLGRINLVLDACRKYRVKKIVFIASGGAIYENASKVPTKEDYPAHPASLYGLANVMIEKYMEVYHKEHGLPYVILRLSNVYGPRQWESGIIPSLITKNLNNQKPVIYGNGSQTRDFVYVDDVVSALLLASGKNAAGIYNVASTKEVSVNNLLALIRQLTGHHGAKPLHMTSKEQGVKRSALSIQKIKKEFAWLPKTSLKKGLEKTVEWFKK